MKLSLFRLTNCAVAEIRIFLKFLEKLIEKQESEKLEFI